MALPDALMAEVIGAMGEAGLRTFELRGCSAGRAQVNAAFSQGPHAMSDPVASIAMAAELMARAATAAKELAAERGDAGPGTLQEATTDVG